jgi:hypothetical protein
MNALELIAAVGLGGVILYLAREPIFMVLDWIIHALLLLLNVLLAIVAWIGFCLGTWWYIPKDANSRTLETSEFFISHLAFGQTLYSQNLAWRRDLSKYRAAVRNGEVPVPRFRFTWKGYVRALLD